MGPWLKCVSVLKDFDLFSGNLEARSNCYSALAIAALLHLVSA